MLLKECDAWLLQRVAKTVEAGEVPSDLLAELQKEIEATQAMPEEIGHAAAMRQIAERAGMEEAQAEEVLATMQAQPTVTRELLMRWIAEAWLEGQRREWGLRRKPPKTPDHEAKCS